MVDKYHNRRFRSPKKSVLTAGELPRSVIGWRKVEDDYLRVGAMLDSEGNRIEIKLPVNQLSNSARHGKLVGSLGEIFELDKEKAELVEDTKNQLRDLGYKNFTKMREGGLFRLRNEIASDDRALSILDKFAEAFIPLASRRTRSFDRLSEYRDWVYQNAASFLAANYDALIWEGVLSLKTMAEERNDLSKTKTTKEYSDELVHRKAAKYKSFASLHSFRDYLKKAFDKQGKTIINGNIEYLNRKCSVCGQIVEKFNTLRFVCPNGHKFDRSFNAAKNLLDQLSGEYQTAGGNALKIPDQPHRDLSKILILIPAG